MVKENKRYRVTLNFSESEFKLFQEASDILEMSPGQLIKQSLLQDSVVNLLKLLITNKQTIIAAKNKLQVISKNESE